MSGAGVRKYHNQTLWRRVFGFRVGDVVAFDKDYRIYGLGLGLIWVRKGEKALVIASLNEGEVMLKPFREDLNHMQLRAGEEQIIFLRSAKVGKG